MNYNDCEICQHHEDVVTAKEFLKKAVEASLFALMYKTEEAYEKESVAKGAFLNLCNHTLQLNLH